VPDRVLPNRGIGSRYEPATAAPDGLYHPESTKPLSRPTGLRAEAHPLIAPTIGL